MTRLTSFEEALVREAIRLYQVNEKEQCVPDYALTPTTPLLSADTLRDIRDVVQGAGKTPVPEAPEAVDAIRPCYRASLLMPDGLWHNSNLFQVEGGLHVDPASGSPSLRLIRRFYGCVSVRNIRGYMRPEDGETIDWIPRHISLNKAVSLCGDDRVVMAAARLEEYAVNKKGEDMLAALRAARMARPACTLKDFLAGYSPGGFDLEACVDWVLAPRVPTAKWIDPERLPAHEPVFTLEKDCKAGSGYSFKLEEAVAFSKDTRGRPWIYAALLAPRPAFPEIGKAKG